MVKSLLEIPGLNCFTPSGAFYVFPDCSSYLGRRTPDGTKIETSTDLCIYLLETHGVAVGPGDAGGGPGGCGGSDAAPLEARADAGRMHKSACAERTRPAEPSCCR